MDTVRTDLAWEDVERLVRSLAAHVAAASQAGPFDRVVGIARGGLIPAVLVASLLDIKRIETVQMHFYQGHTRADEPERLGAPPAPAGPSGDPSRTLVIDEIVDSGETMRCVHVLLPEATKAVLVARNAPAAVARHEDLSAFAVRGAGARVWTAGVLHTDAWILFPWSPNEDRSGEDASE